MRISDWSSDVCSSDLLRRRMIEARGLRLQFRFLDQVALAAPEIEIPAQVGANLPDPIFATAIRRRNVVILGEALAHFVADRKSVVSGKSVSVRVVLGGRRLLKKKTSKQTTNAN